MFANNREALNQFYRPLDDQMRTLLSLLKQWHGKRVVPGWFNGHYHKDAGGAYQKDVYPIPVISVMGLCDIEIDMDGITITSKLSTEQLQAIDWSNLKGTPFEVYGVEDYLTDYGTDQNAEELASRAIHSSEKEFFISFSLSLHAPAEQVMDVLEILYDIGFYY